MLRAAGAGLAVLAFAAPALAHGTGGAFVLLLPTGYYLAGGVAAVAASFVIVSLVAPGAMHCVMRWRAALAPLPRLSPIPFSLASFGLLAALVAAGFWGSRDPLANPLPLAIWTMWWVGLVLLQAVLGNLWAFLNPWTGPAWLMGRLTAGRIDGGRPRLPYPAWLSYWPAILFFLGFAWFELVYPAPDDPERLATVVALYWIIAFGGVLLFGEAAWLGRAEPFSIFFRLVAGLSPFAISDADDRRRLGLRMPGAGLVQRAPLPLSGALFVLLTLSSVSFDGLSRTFGWLALHGVNPLEFPGRSALLGSNTAGLVAAFAALTLVFGGAVVLGRKLAQLNAESAQLFGSLVYALLPVSIAFHFAHYLTALLVDSQYALLAASDPLGRGQDLLGLGHRHVTTSFLSTYEGARWIWNAQTVVIVGGHVLAVILAHAIVARFTADRRQAALAHAPLAVLMVLYTAFGLWLLSTPAIG